VPRRHWAAIGRADGERGLEAAQLERHREACAVTNVTPDPAAWRAGYEQGLAAYCTPRGGYLAGRGEAGYRQVCPAATEAAFLAAHRHGREVAAELRELKQLRQRTHELEVAAMSGDYGPEDRTALRFRAEEARQRVRNAEWEVERLDRAYARQYGAPELTWQQLR
jgi:hypothetical protein